MASLGDCELCADDQAIHRVSTDAPSAVMSVCGMCRQILLKEYPLRRNPLPSQLEWAVVNNTHYRQVLYTDTRPGSSGFQLVAMYLPPGGSLGWEAHSANAQYFLIKRGSGRLYTSRDSGGKDRDLAQDFTQVQGSAWMVAAGEYHDFEAGLDGVHLLTIYYPPHHPVDRVDRTFVEAKYRDTAEYVKLPPADVVEALAGCARFSTPLNTSYHVDRKVHAAINELFQVVTLRPAARDQFIYEMAKYGVRVRPVGSAALPANANVPRGPHQVFEVVSSGDIVLPYRHVVVSSGSPYLDFF